MHCGRHLLSRNRMSKVTQVLRVGTIHSVFRSSFLSPKDCPLQKATIKKKRFPTHYPLSFPLFLSITRAKKLQSFGAVHQGFLITCSCFYLFFLSLYYRTYVLNACHECTFYCLSLFNVTKGLGSLIPAHSHSHTSDFLHL